ncbi:hypothetical protein QZH41_002944 [Actinostola sp. cb2023]|nr:hypothetical protein QZH41_002944 [Actinostola sp. cb2023]
MRSDMMRMLRDMVQVNQLSCHHGEIQAPRISKEKKAVTSVQGLIQSWNNPFAESQDVVSISTAKQALKDVANDLLKAHEIGEKEYKQFKEGRLECTPPKIKFHDPIKLKKLKTFSSLMKQKHIKAKGRTLILKADRSLFGRMIIMGQSRKIEVKDLLCHSLGPLPWALATPDGLPRKTNKAALATLLQKGVQLAERVPENSAIVIDAMSLVQKLNVASNQTTFGTVASALLSMALNEGGPQSSRIDIVFDTYREISIKNVERSIRGEVQGVQLSNLTESQIIRQWRTFLSQIKNKTSLIRFLAEEWKKEKYKEMLERRGKIMYVTCEDKCWKITGENVEEVPELFSSQEEADTRLLLHAVHAAQAGYETVIVNSEDTDVFILLLAFSSSINSHLLQKCCSNTRIRLVDIKKVARAIGDSTCKALIGLHAFTGCDSVSAFAGKGKAKALKILRGDMNTKETFDQLGETWNLSSDLFAKLEKFTCELYSSRTTQVKDARYNLFCSKNGEIESFQLPPCQDCLRKHALRSNYQASIWKRSLQGNSAIPSPEGMGWKMEVVDDREELQFDWMDGKPAPDAVLELLACRCTRSCKLPTCVCLVNVLKCTDVCILKECDNQLQDDDEVDTYNSDDVDDSDDDDADDED